MLLHKAILSNQCTCIMLSLQKFVTSNLNGQMQFIIQLIRDVGRSIAVIFDDGKINYHQTFLMMLILDLSFPKLSLKKKKKSLFEGLKSKQNMKVINLMIFAKT